MIITVYYEDKMGVNVKGFGPHELLIACVCDARPESDPWDLKRRVQAIPKGGDSKVLRALAEEGPRARGAGAILALLDHDQIRNPLNLDGAACKTHVLALIRDRFGAPPDEIVLLEKNTETLILAACQQLALPAPRGKPSPDERDRILSKLAWNPERAVRDSLRQAIPSFDRLVRRVSALLPSKP
jgi:hypothetical protein